MIIHAIERTVYSIFYFNAEFSPSNQNGFFTPYDGFKNNSIKIWFQAGQKTIFYAPNFKIDVDYFFKNRVYSKKHVDLIMKLYVMDNSGQNTECFLQLFVVLLSNQG